jgi:radical SAM superfamily enzyme YgiQ (UPF0313 family)
MKITFIRPHFTDRRSADAMEPLAFAVLAGLTPPHVEMDFFDERLEAIPDHHDTDLVALTVETFTARRAYQIATGFRQRGIPVVMGGYHPSFLPEEALVYADAAVIGDAEGVWDRLVQDAQQGKLQRVYRQSKQPSLDGLKFDRSIFQSKRYKPIAPVQYGRGCRYACDFCSIHALYGSHTRQRPVTEVVAEVEALDRKHIVFVDDNLFVDEPKAEELFRALIPLNIHWACQVSIDIVQHPQLMDLMADSGCFCAMIGFESLNKDNLMQMKKKWNVEHADYDTAVQRFRERGIMIYASFVLGYDHDTVDTFDTTAEFAVQCKFLLANLVPLNPTPASKVYDRLMNDNRLIFERWWLHPDYRYGQATFHPLRMTPDELAEGCLRARRKFHGYESILKRALDLKANSRDLYHLGFYLGANLLARRELSYKLGHRLGANTSLQPALENVPLKPPSSEGLGPNTAIGG